MDGGGQTRFSAAGFSGISMRTLCLAAAAASLCLLAVPAFAQSPESYDDSWYRAPFWSGEYPDGFSVARTTTVQLRPALDPKADKTIACELPQGATYQPWNQSRVEEQGLAFTSFTKIATYKITKPYETTLYKHLDGTELKVSFKPGDTFRYLVYFGEGAFLMEYDGVEYDGDQDLFEHAEQEGDSNGYEEWLRINCSNNHWGWLFMGDVTLDDGIFVSPNITEYGTAEDLK
jgi:hypothetical protein